MLRDFPTATDAFPGPRYARTACMRKLLIAAVVVASAGLGFSGIVA
jgi:hypothetical protein